GPFNHSERARVGLSRTWYDPQEWPADERRALVPPSARGTSGQVDAQQHADTVEHVQAGAEASRSSGGSGSSSSSMLAAGSRMSSQQQQQQQQQQNVDTVEHVQGMAVASKSSSSSMHTAGSRLPTQQQLRAHTDEQGEAATEAGSSSSSMHRADGRVHGALAGQGGTGHAADVDVAPPPPAAAADAAPAAPAAADAAAAAAQAAAQARSAQDLADPLGSPALQLERMHVLATPLSAGQLHALRQRLEDMLLAEARAATAQS
ncbi:hypothetical protein FOA52_009248, partial [Chlamydomonas sp. UWO 241]